MKHKTWPPLQMIIPKNPNLWKSFFKGQKRSLIAPVQSCKFWKKKLSWAELGENFSWAERAELTKFWSWAERAELTHFFCWASWAELGWAGIFPEKNFSKEFYSNGLFFLFRQIFSSFAVNFPAAVDQK